MLFPASLRPAAACEASGGCEGAAGSTRRGAKPKLWKLGGALDERGAQNERAGR